MVNHVLSRESVEARTIDTPGVRRRHWLIAGAVGVAAVAIFFAAVVTTSDSEATTSPVRADALRWQALVAREYPGATPGAAAAADRLTALAAAYGDGRILTPGRVAEKARWQGIADSYTRPMAAETARWQGIADSYARPMAAEAARWSGLAEHHLQLPAPLQAAADRYQGWADANE